MTSVPTAVLVEPLTIERWPDFEILFGPNGACGGCWCTWWKLPHADFKLMKGDGARQAQREIVAAGTVPGLLAYVDGLPIGWIAVEPRAAYPRLARSRVLKAVDDQPVWSVTCFFISKRMRRRGVTVALLRAAIEHVRQNGGRIIEGYPVEPREGKSPDAFVFTGLPGAFRAAGFVEVARHSPTRPIYRITLED